MTALFALAALAILAIAVVAAVQRRAAAASPPAADQHRYDAIRAARRELKAANREHAAVLREVQRELRRAQAPREIARIAGHTLLDDAIKTPTGTHCLTDAVTATVEDDSRRPGLIIEVTTGCRRWRSTPATWPMPWSSPGRSKAPPRRQRRSPAGAPGVSTSCARASTTPAATAPGSTARPPGSRTSRRPRRRRSRGS